LESSRRTTNQQLGSDAGSHRWWASVCREESHKARPRVARNEVSGDGQDALGKEPYDGKDHGQKRRVDARHGELAERAYHGELATHADHEELAAHAGHGELGMHHDELAARAGHGELAARAGHGELAAQDGHMTERKAYMAERAGDGELMVLA